MSGRARGRVRGRAVGGTNGVCLFALMRIRSSISDLRCGPLTFRTHPRRWRPRRKRDGTRSASPWWRGAVTTPTFRKPSSGSVAVLSWECSARSRAVGAVSFGVTTQYNPPRTNNPPRTSTSDKTVQGGRTIWIAVLGASRPACTYNYTYIHVETPTESNLEGPFL